MKPIFTSAILPTVPLQTFRWRAKDLSPHFLSQQPEANTELQLNSADANVNDAIDVTSGIWLASPVNI